MTTIVPMRTPTLLLLVLIGATSLGCVERRLRITSDPPGALVFLNDQDAGRTPLEVPFTWYGVYTVRAEKDGFQTLHTERVAEQPWWETPGPDLIAEALPNREVEIAWHLELEPEQALPADSAAYTEYLDQLRFRAGTLRELNRRDEDD